MKQKLTENGSRPTTKVRKGIQFVETTISVSSQRVKKESVYEISKLSIEGF